MKSKGETFGETIRRLRKAAHKTLQQMADAVGVSVAYYSEVELGKRPPFKAERIQILAKELSTPADALFTLSWQDRRLITFDTDDLSPNEADILQSFARGGLTKEQIGEIREIVKRKA